MILKNSRESYYDHTFFEKCSNDHKRNALLSCVKMCNFIRKVNIFLLRNLTNHATSYMNLRFCFCISAAAGPQDGKHTQSMLE